MAQDYYEILQVHPRADSEAIAAAYARLHALYDPQRLDGAADEFVELARQKRDQIERAYAVLFDPVRRASFDAELAAAQLAPSAAASSDGATSAAATHQDAVFDYRPLPPAGRAERPRGFDEQPVRTPVVDGSAAPAGTRWPRLTIAFAGLLVLAVVISLAVTGGGRPPAGTEASAPSATAAPFDQFEPQIPELRQAAQQNANDPQAWIDYGNLLYNSVEIVRENAPQSTLYQQRLPRWLEATDAYSRALTLEPNNAATRADLGASSCFYGVGVGDQRFVQSGTSEARRAATAAPDDPRVQLSLGHCLVSAQPPQIQDAIASWRRVVQLAPANSPLAAQAQDLIAQYSR